MAASRAGLVGALDHVPVGDWPGLAARWLAAGFDWVGACGALMLELTGRLARILTS